MLLPREALEKKRMGQCPANFWGVKVSTGPEQMEGEPPEAAAYELKAQPKAPTPLQ